MADQCPKFGTKVCFALICSHAIVLSESASDAESEAPLSVPAGIATSRGQFDTRRDVASRFQKSMTL